MEQRISIERLEQAVNIFGSFDENIRLLEQEFSVTVVNRDGELRVDGEAENVMLACKAIQALLTLSSRGAMSMVWLTAKCLIWQGVLALLAIAAINLITMSRFDYNGSRRKKKK